jgi:acylphosphatase
MSDDNPMRTTKRVRVEGRVQGVGFRAFVEREATRIGLDGFVRNRRDGGVEAVFAGTSAQLDAIIAACHRGPRGSQIDMVKVLDESDEVPAGFAIRETA